MSGTLVIFMVIAFGVSFIIRFKRGGWKREPFGSGNDKVFLMAVGLIAIASLLVVAAISVIWHLHSLPTYIIPLMALAMGLAIPFTLLVRRRSK